jgi:DNA gyrase subunit A
VIRTPVSQIRPSGRDTMGVRLMNLAEGDTVVAVARSSESEGDDETVDAVAEGETTA